MQREQRILGALAMGIGWVALLLFWPCLNNGFTHWDDNLYLDLANVHRISWAGVCWAFTNTYIYYHPLTWLSHGLDCQLWGLQPAGHHAASVIFHACNAGLVVVFVGLLLQSVTALKPVERVCLAGWVGLIFAVHPLQVEAVAWVAERKTLLCTFFALSCLIFYVQWTRAEQRRRFWWMMLVAYVCALLSKPMAVPLIAVLILLDFYPLRRWDRLGWRKGIGEKWILLLLTVIIVGLTMRGQAQMGALHVIDLTIPQRFLVMGRSLVFYLWKIVWPDWLSPFYPLGAEIDWRRPEFLVPLLGCALMSGLALWRRQRWPALLPVWGAYVVLVLPVSGVLQAGGQAAADRFAYLPMVAILAGVGYVLVRLGRLLRAAIRPLLFALLAVHAGWLMMRTRAQIPVWKDDVTLWQAVVFHYPESQDEYRMIAQGLVLQGRFDEAMHYADHAYAVVSEAHSRELLGLVYRDMAIGLLQQHRLSESVPLAKRAVVLAPQEPTVQAAMGLVDLKNIHYREAIPELELALQLRPDLAATRYNLACAYSETGKLTEAFAALQKAVQDAPRLLAMARRDPALASLRANPEYASRLQKMTDQGTPAK